MEKLQIIFEKKTLTSSDLISLVSTIKHEDHYFKKNNFKDEYYAVLAKYLELMIKDINGINEFENFFKNNLHFYSNKYDENEFLRFLAEVVVAGGIYENIKKYPDIYSGYKYEKIISGETNVDSSFYWDKYKCNINIEVKCPNYDQFIGCEGHNILWGRFEEKNEETSNFIKRRDNTAKDFLISGNKKFSDSSEKDLNILVICVTDFIDQAMWVSYFIQNKVPGYSGGIFTDPEAYSIDFNDFSNVDFVIVTDAYMRLKKNITSDFINLNQCHNSLFPNDKSLRNEVFLQDLTDFELSEIKNNINIDYYENRYPKLFKYFEVADFFNSHTAEFIKFLRDNSNSVKDKNWLLYYFLLRKDFNLLHPFIEVFHSNDDLNVFENKYYFLFKDKKGCLNKYLISQGVLGINIDEFIIFLKNFDDEFISFLGCEDNVYQHKVENTYCETSTFLSMAINLFLFKVNNDINNKVSLNFRKKQL